MASIDSRSELQRVKELLEKEELGKEGVNEGTAISSRKTSE